MVFVVLRKIDNFNYISILLLADVSYTDPESGKTSF